MFVAMGGNQREQLTASFGIALKLGPWEKLDFAVIGLRRDGQLTRISHLLVSFLDAG